MAVSKPISVLAILMVLASATMEMVSSLPVRGSVTCVDCSSSYDFSGIFVAVKCDQMTKPVMATTKLDGSFSAELPSNAGHLTNCKARLLGGPNQLYASNKNMVSKVTRVSDHGDAYTTSSTLTFASSCSSLRKLGKCSSSPFVSSKTIDLPMLPEFGLPPISYYIPFLPIIGIP